LIQKSTGGTVDLGSGDFGVLNYAYAPRATRSGLYTQVVSSPYSGMSTDERNILTSIRDHEVIHREFFKTALGKSDSRASA
jgi:hypothetical protein